MPFLDSLDIANRALQHCGVARIRSVDEVSKNNSETAFAYDTLREPELRRNVWRFSIRKAVLRALDEDTLMLEPHAWDAGTLYLFGALARDTNGVIWQSVVSSNLGNEPGSTTAWEEYFGPLSVARYDATTSYFAGELVYKEAGDPGGFVVFLSLVGSNDDDPATSTAYDATVTYHKDEVVSYGGSMWRSLLSINTGTTPADGPAVFDNTAIYASGDTVTAPDGYIYTSLQNANTGHDPASYPTWWSNTGVPTAWDRTPTLYTSSKKWLPLFATLKAFPIFYPAGSGPSSDTATRNVFRLPNGWLRRAPRDPKAGSVSFLGAPSGLDYDDHLYEGDYIVSRDVGPIVYRFVANIHDVRRMDPMFCEGLACRVAMGVCEVLTQSTAKLSTIASEYGKFMTEARMVNAIETGSEEPPEDDWITCRR